jgi:chromosome segregation protein
MVRQGRIGELIAGKPPGAAVCSKRPPAFPACTRAATRRSSAARRGNQPRAVDDITSQIEGQIEGLKRQSRQANALQGAVRRYPPSGGGPAAHQAGCSPKEPEGDADEPTQPGDLARGRRPERADAGGPRTGGRQRLRCRNGARARGVGLPPCCSACRSPPRSQLEERTVQRIAELERCAAVDGRRACRRRRAAREAIALDEENARSPPTMPPCCRAASSRRRNRRRRSRARRGRRTRRRGDAWTRPPMRKAKPRSPLRRNARKRRHAQPARRPRPRSLRTPPASAPAARCAGRVELEDMRRRSGSTRSSAAATLADAEAALAGRRMLAAAKRRWSAARFAARPSRSQAARIRARLAGSEREARSIRVHAAGTPGDGSFAPVARADVHVDRGYETALGAALGDDLESSTDISAHRRLGVSPADVGRSASAERCTALDRSRPRAGGARTGGWPRSASSRAVDEAALLLPHLLHRPAARQPCRRPCGVGTAMWPPPTRQVLPPFVSNKRTASPNSKPNSKTPARPSPMPAP